VWYNTLTHKKFKDPDMNNLRLSVVLAASLLSLAACGKTEEHGGTDASGNFLLAYAPVDTPYLAGNLEPIPDAVIDAFITRFQPVLDAVQSDLSKLHAKLASEPDPADQGERLVYAIIGELDGKLSRQGIDSLGFKLRSYNVIYGMGAFPVIRFELSDADALRNTVQRILDQAGISAPALVYEGVSYWRLSDDSDQESPIDLYLSILDDHMAVGIFPPLAEADMLPGFLGLELPEESNAAARLAELNRKHDYSSYGSGILELARLAEEFLSPDPVMTQVLSHSGEHNPENLPAWRKNWCSWWRRFPR
jgi:hypothetical protein